AIAWPKADPKAGGELLVWDVAADKTERFEDGSLNAPLAVRAGRNGAAGEIVSGGFVNFAGAAGKPQLGRLALRPADGGPDKPPINFLPEGGKFFLPLAVAAVGESTAVLLENTGPRADKAVRPTELLLLGADGRPRTR